MPSAKRRRRIKTPPLLFEKTQTVLAQIQKRVRGTFLTYWTSTSGSVCDNDVMALHELLQDLGPQRQVTLFVKSDGGSGHGRAAHGPPAAPLRAAADRARAAQLRVGGHHARPRRRPDRAWGPLSYLTAVDTSLEHDLSPVDHTNNLVAVSNDEVDRVIRLWKETRGRATTARQPLPGALQVPPSPGHRRPRPREQPVPDALPRDPGLPHEGQGARRSASAAGSTRPIPRTSTRSRAARRGGSASTSTTSTPSSTELLQELNLLYSEMGQRAITDFDEENHHDNEITNILEGGGLQVFYQVEKDWHYRKEERRWVPMNDVSAWYRCHPKAGRVVKEKFHIR